MLLQAGTHCRASKEVSTSSVCTLAVKKRYIHKLYMLLGNQTRMMNKQTRMSWKGIWHRHPNGLYADSKVVYVAKIM